MVNKVSAILFGTLTSRSQCSPASRRGTAGRHFPHICRCMRRKLPVVMPPIWGERRMRPGQLLRQKNQGILCFYGLREKRVKPGAAQFSALNGLAKGLGVNQLSPAGVDEEGPVFHPGDPAAVYKMHGFLVYRHVEAYDVAAGEKFIKRQIGYAVFFFLRDAFFCVESNSGTDSQKQTAALLWLFRYRPAR